MVEVRGQVERASAQAAAEPTVISDVWSRSGSKYRVRAIVLLVIYAATLAAVAFYG